MIYSWFGCPKMGMVSAVSATVIGQIATVILACNLVSLLHKNRQNEKDRFQAQRKDYQPNAFACVCSFLSQISLVAATAAINNMIRKYGATDAIFGQEQYAQIPTAIVDIVTKFFQIVISIIVGMTAGCIPIIGYNNLKQRVKKLFTMLLVSEAAVELIGFILVEFFPWTIINIFGAANESAYYTEFAIKGIILACILYSCKLWERQYLQ